MAMPNRPRMLKLPGRGAGERGSGMAIGVAMIFPMLMLVIVATQALAYTSRIDQNLQATANRVARSASLCCATTGGAGGAAEVVNAGLAAAAGAGARSDLHCNNDLVGDSRIVFVDVAGASVPISANRNVPPGGTVYVLLNCRVPPQTLGPFWLPTLTVQRQAVGTAAIDPYRNRSGP